MFSVVIYLPLMSLVRTVEMPWNASEEPISLLHNPVNKSSRTTKHYNNLNLQQIFHLPNSPEKLNKELKYPRYTLIRNLTFIKSNVSAFAKGLIKCKFNKVNTNDYDKVQLKSSFFPVYNSSGILNKIFDALKTLGVTVHQRDQLKVQTKINEDKKNSLKTQISKGHGYFRQKKEFASKNTLNSSKRFERKFSLKEIEVLEHEENFLNLQMEDHEENNPLIPPDEYPSTKRNKTQQKSNSAIGDKNHRESVSVKQGNISIEVNDTKLSFFNPFSSEAKNNDNSTLEKVQKLHRKNIDKAQKLFLYIRPQNIKGNFHIVTSKPMHIFSSHQHLILQEQHHQIPNVEGTRSPVKQSARQPRRNSHEM